MFEGAVEELEAATKFRRPQLIFMGLVAVAGAALTTWTVSTAAKMTNEAETIASPVVEALVADDRAGFDALTSLGEKQDERFAALREQIGERDAVTLVQCTSVSQTDGRTSAGCVAHFEGGEPLGVSLSSRGETVVRFELRPAPASQPKSWYERLF